MDKIVSYLCDPFSRLDLLFDSAQNSLICGAKKYPVKDRILYFLEDNRLSEKARKNGSLFSFLSPIYDFLIDFSINLKNGSGFAQKTRKKIMSILPVNDGENVLEIAVGTGINIKNLNKNAHYFGLDISKGMLKTAGKNLKKWGLKSCLIHGNAENLPFKNDVLDKVLNIFGLFYFDDPEKALEEMYRVTKQSGEILLVYKKEWEALVIESKVLKKMKTADSFSFIDGSIVGVRLVKI